MIARSVHEDVVARRGSASPEALEPAFDDQRPAPDMRRRAGGQAHYYYGHYYAVQAMYLAGGEHWQRWWPAIRQELMAKQASSGGWLDHHAGGAYATAMSLIILQMPKRYLPIFQR